MLGRTDSRLRMVALLLLFSVFGAASTLRLGYWQVMRTDLAVRATNIMTPVEEVEITRAPIVDRDDVVLAQTISFDRLVAHPVDIDPDDRAPIIETLTEILDLDPGQQEAYAVKLSSGAEYDRLRQRLSHQQSVEVALAIDAGDLPGIALEPADVRAYPRQGGQGGTTLASHVLGFVAGDGRGAYGVERRYDARLSGEEQSPLNVASLVGVPTDLGAIEPPPLRLTIDAGLQQQLEKELSTAYLADRAKSVSAVIMDPYSGAILASASVPAYDANEYAKVAQDRMGRLRDPVVSEMFEPGSVMKIFTATSALDKGVATPKTTIVDERRMQFYQHAVTNADGLGKGRISVKKVIAYSRNVATAKIAQRLAPKSTQQAARVLYKLWDRVGLVGRTGVDIAGESEGSYTHPDSQAWAPVDLANRSFGQGVAVTLVQLARGFSTLVNGGYVVQPHVVADGDAARVPRRRVLDAKVAKQAQNILEYVTGGVPWYARGTLIPGYLIGGKTGTAQIWDPERGDWKDKFNHNFVGFVGRKRPEAVIALRIEEAKYKLVNGVPDLKVESYELFAMIARAAIKHLHIKRSRDPWAGRPIPGSQAARVLDPTGYGQPRQAARRRARQEARQQVSGAGGQPAGQQTEAASSGADARDGRADARKGRTGQSAAGRNGRQGGQHGSRSPDGSDA